MIFAGCSAPLAEEKGEISAEEAIKIAMTSANFTKADIVARDMRVSATNGFSSDPNVFPKLHGKSYWKVDFTLNWADGGGKVVWVDSQTGETLLIMGTR